MLLQNLKIYIRQYFLYHKKHKSNINIIDLIRYYPDWKNNLNCNLDSFLDKEIPWFTYPAITFLSKTLTTQMKVFEYGTGGSTLFFAKRVNELHSVEHDQLWGKRIIERVIKSKLSNCEFNIVEPITSMNNSDNDTSNPESFISENLDYSDKSFERYTKEINKFEDNYFDMIIIDGRARPSCFKYARSKLKTNGFIVLDNSERKHYKYIFEELKNSSWKMIKLNGPGPINHYFWDTTVWEKI